MSCPAQVHALWWHRIALGTVGCKHRARLALLSLTLAIPVRLISSEPLYLYWGGTSPPGPSSTYQVCFQMFLINLLLQQLLLPTHNKTFRAELVLTDVLTVRIKPNVSHCIQQHVMFSVIMRQNIKPPHWGFVLLQHTQFFWKQ